MILQREELRDQDQHEGRSSQSRCESSMRSHRLIVSWSGAGCSPRSGALSMGEGSPQACPLLLCISPLRLDRRLEVVPPNCTAARCGAPSFRIRTASRGAHRKTAAGARFRQLAGLPLGYKATVATTTTTTPAAERQVPRPTRHRHDSEPREGTYSREALPRGPRSPCRLTARRARDRAEATTRSDPVVRRARESRSWQP